MTATIGTLFRIDRSRHGEVHRWLLEWDETHSEAGWTMLYDPTVLGAVNRVREEAADLGRDALWVYDAQIRNAAIIHVFIHDSDMATAFAARFEN